MKRILFLSAAMVAAVSMSSCGGAAEGDAAATDSTASAAAEVATWMVDPAASTVRWECGTAGAMVYSHFGNISLKEGSLTSEGTMLTGGSFTIDMNTIVPQDNGYSEEHPASDLVAHLGSPDFFDVANNPTASFTIKAVSGNTITGDLTVRGITNEETITVDAANMNADGTMTATGTLNFNRQKYDVKWAHYVKDVLLNDEIQLTINLVGKKA